MSTNSVARYEVQGVTDDVNECWLCGKIHLKRTVGLFDREDERTVFYGTTCAAKVMGVKVSDVKAAIIAAEDTKREAEAARRNAEAEASRRKWVDFLVRKTGGLTDPDDGRLDVGGMMRTLGGFGPARAMFRAECQ